MQEISITAEGIQKNLKGYKPLDALCEYVWNGFDAQASKVEIKLHTNEFGLINMITVIDNGTGIAFDELQYKFKPFNDSSKAGIQNRINHTLPHGRQGIGRLTFFSFAQMARWTTIYSKNGKIYKYYIEMDKDSLNKYDDNGGNAPTEVSEQTGTQVSFTQIGTFSKDEIIQKIETTFFWFLELNKDKGYSIEIDGEKIDYEKYKQHEFEIDVSDLKLSHKYKIKAIHWNCALGSEYSKFYFLESSGDEKYKEATKLNKKSDEFYHSIYIQSDYFNDFLFEKDSIVGQKSLFPNKYDVEYKVLMERINQQLVEYRKTYLKASSDKYISKLIESQIYPEFDGNNLLDLYKKSELDNLVGTLYAAQPKIFTNLSDDNKKITIRLLNLIMETGNKGGLFDVLKQVIDLDDDELQELAGVLKYTSLSNITKVIKLLEDRQKVIQGLKELVFNKEFNAYEVPHIQSVVENHYWIFGEQYGLITAAEPDFEQALMGLILSTTGNKENVSLTHEDKNKEMDIYMIRQDRKGDITENVVVELKRPSVPLGEEQLSQVKKYLRVIQSDDRFNMGNVKWTFYLVGNKFNKNKYIEGELENKKSAGESHLVYSQDNNMTKIYVLKWSEIFDDYAKRHEFLMSRLKLEEKLWLEKHESADDVVDDITNNSAQMQDAIVPKNSNV